MEFTCFHSVFDGNEGLQAPTLRATQVPITHFPQSSFIYDDDHEMKEVQVFTLADDDDDDQMVEKCAVTECDRKEEMVEVCCQSRMNMKWARRELIESHWDYRQAIDKFDKVTMGKCHPKHLDSVVMYGELRGMQKMPKISAELMLLLYLNCLLCFFL
jgi:hypothetical protein